MLPILGEACPFWLSLSFWSDHHSKPDHFGLFTPSSDQSSRPQRRLEALLRRSLHKGTAGCTAVHRISRFLKSLPASITRRWKTSKAWRTPCDHPCSMAGVSFHAVWYQDMLPSQVRRVWEIDWLKGSLQLPVTASFQPATHALMEAHPCRVVLWGHSRADPRLFCGRSFAPCHKL